MMEPGPFQQSFYPDGEHQYLLPDDDGALPAYATTRRTWIMFCVTFGVLHQKVPHRAAPGTFQAGHQQHLVAETQQVQQLVDRGRRLLEAVSISVRLAQGGWLTSGRLTGQTVGR